MFFPQAINKLRHKEISAELEESEQTKEKLGTKNREFGKGIEKE